MGNQWQPGQWPQQQQPYGGAPPGRPGWPQQPPPPPKPPFRAGRTIAVVLGSFLVVCVACAYLAIVARRKIGPTPNPSASVFVQKDAAPFVGTLAQLVANPKSIKPTKVTEEKGEQDRDFEYVDPPGIPFHELTVSVRRSNAAAWMILFEEAASTARPEDFAPSGGLVPIAHVPAADAYEITGGPLKGAVMEREGARCEVMSVAYAVDDIFIGTAWLCENGRVPGVKPISVSDFTFQCKEMVKQKLLSPSSAEFPGIFDRVPVGTGKKCARSWNAWVDAKNAFGVTIHRTFACSHDPATNLVSLKLDPL